MAVNQLMICSRIFLGLTIVFLTAAVLVFIMLDVRRAWKILTGNKMPKVLGKKERLNYQEVIINQYKENDATMALEDFCAETMLLAEQKENSGSEMT